MSVFGEGFQKLHHILMRSLVFCCDTFPPPFGGVTSLRNDLPLKQVAFLKGALEVYPEFNY